VASEWLLTTKPAFLNECLALQPKEFMQVQKKLVLLTEDPAADGKAKKQLKNWEGRLHRLRSGDLRVFYTFEAPYISVLALRRRSEDTYDEDLEAEFLGGPGGQPHDAAKVPDPAAAGDAWKRWLEPSAASKQGLSRSIDKALLDGLKVPKVHHAALLKVTTEDALLDCPVPQDVLTRVLDAVCGRPIDQVLGQPDLVVSAPDDLLRFREGGELLGFLLRLNAEQEKFVAWGVRSSGPTLLKGGPGTGKSTVALYRLREMLKELRKARAKAGDATPPRVLFTTYTRALTRVSEQLLRSLLGPDADLVDVRTTDTILRQIATEGTSYSPTLATADDERSALLKAVETAKFAGNSLKVAAQKQTIARIDRGYLLEEILGVIDARPLESLAAYLEAPRPGRGLALARSQREAIWQVRQAFHAVLAARGLTTWEQLRALAAARIERGEVAPRYDAVLIDEAQDLQPVALRALVSLSKTPAGLFLTADANQSIYGGSFRWQDVHASLKFQGHTGVLRANHRSTREIGEGAEAYLADGDEGARLDAEAVERKYVHSGPLPAVRIVADDVDEVKLLARFLRSATRELRLGLGACAVLCPFNKSATRLVGALKALGVDAIKVDASDLDLGAKGVKVLTLKSAKGLEFPVVALAGFFDGEYPVVGKDAPPEERAELVARERRTMYVAMTRAMRALLVVRPAGASSPLLDGCRAGRWNTGAPGEA
jgi:superfamily I DNA/RNA helicase/mRNA-degrading endonuclease RelE of RelBE toxin-antitoxin system